MSASPIAFVRWLSFAGLGLFVMAVGLGSLVEEGPPCRAAVGGGTLILPRDYADEPHLVRAVRAADGASQVLRLPEDETLAHASPSPWRDGWGRGQVVGRWTRHRGRGVERVVESFGLARLEWPSGKVLDRIETAVLPSSEPCWLPGPGARVVYPAADGHLYRFDFEPPVVIGSKIEGDEPRPSPIRWAIRRLGDARLFVSDVARPDAPELAASGLLLASARLSDDLGEDGVAAPSSLWWLRIDPTGTAVIAAGPLGRDRGEPVECRSPRLAAAGGGPVLAFLLRRQGGPAWELALTRLEFEADGRTPRPFDAPARVFAGPFQSPSIAFTADGRHLWAVGRDGTDRSAVVRVQTSLGHDPAGGDGG